LFTCPPKKAVSWNYIEKYVGDEVISKRSVLEMVYSIKNGIIENFYALVFQKIFQNKFFFFIFKNKYIFQETLYHHTFYNELRSAPEEQPLLLIDSILLQIKTEKKFCLKNSIQCLYLLKINMKLHFFLKN
jgi:hypothetical protein